MSLPLIVGNLESWALQALLLIAATGALLALLRVTDPRLRLWTWHGIVGVALLLPSMQSWRIAAASPSINAGVAAARFDWEPWLAAFIAVGIAVRAGWMATGLRELRRLRLTATPWQPLPAWYCGLAADAGVSASLAASVDIDNAVTFGVRRPAILVPGRLLEAPEPHQRAIVAHELHHVARRDWVWVLAEEALRIVLWWHPAIWFALGEAQLAREEIVDRRTIAATGNRTDYLEALIAAVDPAPAGALGFGAQFYHRRQLFTRIGRLLQEENMSTARMLAAAAALAIAVPATVLGASAAFPLTSVPRSIAPQDQPPPPPPPPPATPVVSPSEAPPPSPPPRVSVSRRRSMPPPPPPPPPRPARSSGQDEAPPPPPPPPPGPARAVAPNRDQLPPPPPPPPVPIKEKVLVPVKKVTERPKPVKQVDVKVKPKPGAAVKKDVKPVVKTETKRPVKTVRVRKGGGDQPLR